MYVFFDSNGVIQDIAAANEQITGYASPYPGLTELYLSDTANTDLAQRPDMYKIVSGLPVLQSVSTTPTITLVEAQQNKITELTNSYNQAFLTGFPSSPLGTKITFGCSPISVNNMPSDQQNLNDELNSVNAGIAVYPIVWVAFDGVTPVEFATAAQFKQLGQDFYNFRWAQVGNLRVKITAVQTATTVDQVNAIAY